MRGTPPIRYDVAVDPARLRLDERSHIRKQFTGMACLIGSPDMLLVLLATGKLLEPWTIYPLRLVVHRSRKSLAPDCYFLLPSIRGIQSLAGPEAWRVTLGISTICPRKVF